MTVRIMIGDVRERLAELPDESVHCVVTSPPYFGLRDYGMSGQIGSEDTPDTFVAVMVDVFREVRRVLRSDGTLWLNLGDSYAAARGGTAMPAETLAGGIGGKGCDDAHRGHGATHAHRNAGKIGLKHKDLIGIPWRVAFALQADGWFLRQDIIWCLSGGAWLYARTPTSVGPMMLKDLVRLRPETVELWNGERWTRVTAWTKRTGRADAKELVLRSGERIGCTGNHVWPTQRGNLPTDALEKGDVIQSALLPSGDRASGWLTAEAFWFAGLYLAEGSRSGETIQIAGHIKEASRLARLRELIRHYGGSIRDYNHKGNAQNIHIDSHALSAVLQTLIGGRTAKDKHLTPRAWGYRDWALKELAQGYLDGDGHHDKANGRVRLGFCRNYALERDLRCLAARLGATLTLKPTVAKNQSGRTFPSFRGEWRWQQSGHHNDRDRGEVMDVRNSRARQFWDVTVADEPHLFALASGVLTHNSKPNPMPESVTDRCTKAHEYLFLLSKSARYHYDAAAIAEAVTESSIARLGQPTLDQQTGSDRVPGKTNGTMKAVGGTETRNRRSVWTVATQPFSEAHFATFPPALIEPCILAGCPKDCCAKCGAPVVRVVEVTAPDGAKAIANGRTAKRADGSPMIGDNMIDAGTRGSFNASRGVLAKETLGWSPSCSCDAGTARGVCLDPFGGAGTTALVADRLGRDAVLIELNEQYAEMAKRRLETDAGMFGRVDLVRSAQKQSRTPAPLSVAPSPDDSAPLPLAAVGGASA